MCVLAESRRNKEEGGELDSYEEFIHFFTGPGEIKRREVVLDPQESPQEIKVELGLKVGLWQLFLNSGATPGHCLCDYSAQQWGQQWRGTLVAAQWRADTALTFLLFWRRSTAFLVFRVGACFRAFTLSSP